MKIDPRELEELVRATEPVKKKLKPSQAMFIGIKKTPKARCWMHDPLTGGTCAIGALGVGFGFDPNQMYDWKICEKTGLRLSTINGIMSLNDLGMPRSVIASYLWITGR